MAQYALEAGVSWLATSVSVVASGTWQFAKWSHRYIMQEAEEVEEEPEESNFQQMIDREKAFHNYVRQQIICMWLFMLLYLFAYWLISKLKRKTEREALYAGEEDYFVYRVSVWISSTATATSIGSLTLLPFSVIGVELLQLYDGNYYLQWLSYSLIGALWNYVFVLSNVSLFVLLPFSYFFIESQGFSTSSLGNCTTQRVYEAMAISFLFAFVLLCLAEIVLTILQYPVSFLSITSVNLPLIYSCVSFIGALLLLVSTPYGFAKMFSLARDFLVVEEQPEENITETEELTSEPFEHVVTEAKPSDSEETLNAHETVRSETPHLEDVVTGIVETVDGDGECRKDSDSGIESGSTEEMRIYTDDEDEMVNMETDPASGDAGNTTPTKPRRRRWKHDYASSPVARNSEEPKRLPNPNFDYRNLNDYVRAARRQRSSFSESDDFWVGSPPKNNFSANYYSSRFSRWRHGSEFSLNPSSPLAVDTFASGDSHEATSSETSSTPLSPSRRTKSEEAIWKPVFHTMKSSKFYKRAIEKQSRLLKLFMSLRYPVVITVLLALTTGSLIMVAINTLKLLFGYRSLPVYAQYIEVHTRHSFGLFGACIETLIIIYVMLVSFVGLYSLPVLRILRPVRKDTPMPTIIINSSIVLVVSSALPVAVNTIGMTTFDLLGSHSSLQWLSSFRVVVAYNTMFVVLSIAFLFNQLTASMRRQIWRWVCQLRCGRRRLDDAKDTIVIVDGKKNN